MKPSKVKQALPSPKQKSKVKNFFQCQVCEKTFKYKQHLQSHMGVHSDSRPYHCSFSFCDKTFKFQCNLAEHEKVHSGEKKFQCELCNKRFLLKYCLNRHLLRHSSGRKPFTCESCNIGYWHKSDLNNHRKYTHDPINGLKHICIFCKKAFRGNRDLCRHLSVHTLERPYFCKLCPLELSNKGSLGRHLDTHKQIRSRDFPCGLCSKAFFAKSDLRTHIRTHLAETAYVCDVCKRCFRTKSSLTQHIHVHRDDRPFECGECSWTFKKKAGLKQHQKLHQSLECHTCPFCAGEFTQESYLVDHMRRHTGELPYKCDTCDMAFSTCTRRSHHQQSKHKEVVK